MLKLPKSLGRGCVTSQDDQWASLGEEVFDSLMSEASDHVKGAGTVGGASVVPEVRVSEQACPMWVPLVEYGESQGDGADYFVRKYITELMAKDPEIDTVLLACTHYPLLRSKIKETLPPSISLIAQGELVATSLADYLLRHPEMKQRLSQGGQVSYRTTECPEKFEELASIFMGTNVDAIRVKIDKG